MMMIFFCRKHRHHAWLVEFGCIAGTNYTLAHSCLQRTKGKMMGAYSSSFSSERRRSTCSSLLPQELGFLKDTTKY
jgi:hypothetical protein